MSSMARGGDWKMMLVAWVLAVVESAKDGGRSLDHNAVAAAVVGARGVVAVARAGNMLPSYPDALPEGSDRLHFPGAREQKFG
jgi:hypothetical protein